MRPDKRLLIFVICSGLVNSAQLSALADNEPGIATTSQSASQPESIVDQEKLEAGARFPITVDSVVTSETAQIGDIIEGHLSDDLKVGGRLVAIKGSQIRGHICSVQKARKVLKAELSRHRWLKSAGELGIKFDEIVTTQSDRLPLVATPARQVRFVKDMNEGRVLGINEQGEIVSPLSAQLKSQSIHWGIHVGVAAAGIAGGPIGLSVIPVTYACIGAIDPSFAFMHPVGKNMKHRRIKGFALGLVSGVPGGGFVCDAIVRGPEAIIKPGDSFEVELKETFTGQPTMLANSEKQTPQASATVHGQILPANPDAQLADETIETLQGL